MTGRPVQATGADPLASLRAFEMAVEIAGVEHTIPAYPAAVWLDVLLAEEPDLTALFPGLAGAEAEQAVEDALWDGKLTLEEYNKILQEVLTTASGHPWWFTIRLAVIAREAWDSIGGSLALRGVDPGAIPLARWVDAAYGALRELLKPHDKEQARRSEEILHALLEDPGVGNVEEFDEEREARAFMEVMKSM